MAIPLKAESLGIIVVIDETGNEVANRISLTTSFALEFTFPDLSLICLCYLSDLSLIYLSDLSRIALCSLSL